MPSHLDDLRMVDPVLTTIAKGYANDTFIWDALFPAVAVDKMKGRIPVFGKEAFVIRNADRALLADSNRIPPSGVELVNFETHEYDVEMPMDYLEEEEAGYSRREEILAKQLSDIIALGKERQAATLAQAHASYISALKNEISSGEAFDDYSLSIDPVEIIKDGMEAVRNRIARFPNTVVMGQSSYRALTGHPKILERIKYSGMANAGIAVLKELLGVEDIRVGRAVHTGDGSAFSDIWEDNIVLAYVDKTPKQSRSEYNLSYGYTFQREGKPEIDTYFENGGKRKVIRNTDNYGIKVTASDAAYLIYNTNHS